jgi:hypothetical protein
VALNPITDWSKYEEELMTDWVTIIRWFGWLPTEPKWILKELCRSRSLRCS